MSPSSLAPSLAWHDQALLLGVEVHVFFFDAERIVAAASFAGRSLPIFDHAFPRLVGAEDQRPIYSAGDLWAQPDAVFEHGEGLLCLGWRHSAKTFVERERWKADLRADAMLQSIATAMVVAGSRQAPTAALLRLGNALLLYSPGPQVLECLATSVDAARRYWSAAKGVSAVQLARYCEPVLRALPGVRRPEQPVEMPVHTD